MMIYRAEIVIAAFKTVVENKNMLEGISGRLADADLKTPRARRQASSR